MNQTDKLKMLFPIGTKYSAYRDRSSRNWEYEGLWHGHGKGSCYLGND